MNIKHNSIVDLSLWTAKSIFYDIADRLDRACAVNLVVRKFEYETKNSSHALDIKIFKEIFYDVASDPEAKPIKGVVHLVDYEASREVVDLCIFCGGVKHNPESKQDLPEELHAEAEITLKLYWAEVAKHFALPPTRVYKHVPAYGSCFHASLSWEFCFIYLNDDLGQGIVLSGSTFN